MCNDAMPANVPTLRGSLHVPERVLHQLYARSRSHDGRKVLRPRARLDHGELSKDDIRLLKRRRNTSTMPALSAPVPCAPTEVGVGGLLTSALARGGFHRGQHVL